MNELAGAGFRLRPWRVGDAAALVVHANDARVSAALSDRFPFPYTAADARLFLGGVLGSPARSLAIEIDGSAVGGIGHVPGDGVHRIATQVGYWLGVAFWGRGVMSGALPLWCDHLLISHGFERLQAIVYANNPASARVLEKSGFVFEGVQRRAAIKRGEVLDVLMYARLRENRASSDTGQLS